LSCTGIDSSHSIYFTLPQTHVARTAKIHIYYAFFAQPAAAVEPTSSSS